VSRAATIGLDVGGTKVAGGLLTADNRLLAARERSILVDGARDPRLEITLGLAAELMTEAETVGLEVDGIGAGFPEYVDAHGRLTSDDVMSWTRQPADLLVELAPTTVESDVRCAALGEGTHGVARGLESFAFVIVGTGLSYALVENGRVRAGARGEAIGLGQLGVSRRIFDDGATDRLERYASGDGIRERYEAHTGRAASGAAEVFRLAQNGDRAATDIIQSAGRALGEGLATLVWLLDPGAVVIGGGVSNAGGPWRESLESSYAARLASRPAPPSLLWAELGSDSGIIGAAMAHRRRMSRTASA
jgi:glucokinase